MVLEWGKLDKLMNIFTLRVGTGVGYARRINAEYISYSGLVLEQGTLDEINAGHISYSGLVLE